MPEFLFAYGTLNHRTGCAPVDRLMRRARTIGSAWVQGRIYDLGRYPGALPSNRVGERVYGTVYRLPSRCGCLATLDRYEDYDPASVEFSEFIRARTTAWLMPRGTPMACWIYWYARPLELARIMSGRYWCRTRRRRHSDPATAHMKRIKRPTL